jgi:hypothetical protein
VIDFTLGPLPLSEIPAMRFATSAIAVLNALLALFVAFNVGTYFKPFFGPAAAGTPQLELSVNGVDELPEGECFFYEGQPAKLLVDQLFELDEKSFNAFTETFIHEYRRLEGREDKV